VSVVADAAGYDITVTAPEAPDRVEEILPKILGILEQQIDDSGTLQKFVVELYQRVDVLEEAAAGYDTQLAELRAEVAQLEKKLKKAKKK
jgi:cell division protein FtsB